jgi:hypothetical protein
VNIAKIESLCPDFGGRIETIMENGYKLVASRQYSKLLKKKDGIKMKKIMAFVLPIKAMAAMIFAGFICLYMISGILYAVVTGVEFNYMIPFAFVFQGLGLSVLISILWELFFGNTVIKKWRFFYDI